MPLPLVTAAVVGSNRERPPVSARVRLDAETFTQLYRTYHPQLVPYVQSFPGVSAADASDIVHDLFLRIWQIGTIPSVRREIAAYLYTGVRNIWRRYQKKETIRATWRARERSRPGHGVTHLTPEGVVLHKEVRHIICRTLARMPALYRAAYTLRQEHGYSVRQIADQLRIAPGSVRKYVARTHAAVTRALVRGGFR